jgi:hypothetical protein
MSFMRSDEILTRGDRPRGGGRAAAICWLLLALAGSVEVRAGSESPKIAGGDVCPPFFLRDEAGEMINPVQGINTARPYSPKKTCGACHDYDKITSGFHFTQGAEEQPAPDLASRSAWVLSPGSYGGPW